MTGDPDDIFGDVEFDIGDLDTEFMFGDGAEEAEEEGPLPTLGAELRNTMGDRTLRGMQEHHRKHFHTSQSDFVGNLIIAYGNGEKEPKTVAFTHGRDVWLNGCRVSLRRYWEKALERARKSGQELTAEDKLYLHYQNYQSFQVLGYSVLEMWLDRERFQAPSRNDIDLLGAFKKRESE